MPDRTRILILVHPGSACGSADFNLGIDAPHARRALAEDIRSWNDDIFIVDGELSDEILLYPEIGIAIENVFDRKNRRVIREKACDYNGENWPAYVSHHVEENWPGGPHEIKITGAWVQDDGNGCVNAVANYMSQHRVEISGNALRLP